MYLEYALSHEKVQVHGNFSLVKVRKTSECGDERQGQTAKNPGNKHQIRSFFFSYTSQCINCIKMLSRSFLLYCFLPIPMVVGWMPIPLYFQF